MSFSHETGPVSLHLKNLRLIASYPSDKCGSVDIYRHPQLGQVMVLNNEIQHVEAWAPLYHEMLIHIAASFIPKISNVLILGGGSFYSAHEIIKYQSISRITMVDYDPAVLNAVKKHYTHARAVNKDRRLDIINNDIFSYIKSTDVKYDLIINDSVDLLNYGRRAINRYLSIESLLFPTGICSDLIYRHIFEKKTVQQTISILNKLCKTAYSLVTVPEYPGVLHLLTIWGKCATISQGAKKVINREQRAWLKTQKTPCVFYDPKFITFYLYLPSYLRKVCDVETKECIVS